MKKVKVVEMTPEPVTQELSLDEAERRVVEACKRGYMVVVDGEFLRGPGQARRILEVAKEVYIVPPVSGG